MDQSTHVGDAPSSSSATSPRGDDDNHLRKGVQDMSCTASRHLNDAEEGPTSRWGEAVTRYDSECERSGKSSMAQLTMVEVGQETQYREMKERHGEVKK